MARVLPPSVPPAGGWPRVPRVGETWPGAYRRFGSRVDVAPYADEWRCEIVATGEVRAWRTLREAKRWCVEQVDR